MKRTRAGGAECVLASVAFACLFITAPGQTFAQDPGKEQATAKPPLALVAQDKQDKPDAAKEQAEAKQRFLEQLNKGKYAITLDAGTGKTTGPGMGVLSDATVDAQFVLIGEDHGIAEIPQFMGSVFETLAPRGFHTLAIETGPYVTSAMQENVSRADGAAQMGAFVKKYPFSVAFYNWREEFALLQRCGRAESDGKVSLWGLDQELMGSSGFLLKRISEQMLGPDARAMASRMTKENDDDHAATVKTGDPSGLFMMKAKDADLNIFADSLKTQGTPAAEKMLASLRESREIYAKYYLDEGYASNRERALLMKRNFKQDYLAASQTEPLPKVMFKFGGTHMYRGLNPLHSSEIGNLVAELAEWNGTKSVHILILGVKGTEAGFAGIGRPSTASPLDLRSDPRADFAYLAPMLENMLKDSWTMYDLRTLRGHFGSYGKLDSELERMIFGYDFLVLIPSTTASHDFE